MPTDYVSYRVALVGISDSSEEATTWQNIKVDDFWTTNAAPGRVVLFFEGGTNNVKIIRPEDKDFKALWQAKVRSLVIIKDYPSEVSSDGSTDSRKKIIGFLRNSYDRKGKLLRIEANVEGIYVNPPEPGK